MRAILLATLAASLAGAALAQEAIHAIDLDALDYATNPNIPGVETAVVFGDRDATGLYTTHARVSAGARILPHTHPNPLTTVVTSGTAYVGTGTTFDEGRLKTYPTGSFFVTPAGSPHFIYAKDGAFSILDHGSGPTGFALVESD